MARAASDSGNEVETTKKLKASKEKAAEDVNNAPSEGESEDDEPEYEIEAIIDAKRGVFENGVMGYLVRWKGFTSKDDSWVREEDAGNAKDLIDEYWAKKKAKKEGPVYEAKPKAPRKSNAKESSPAPEAASTTKKRGRGRPSKSKQDADQEADEDDTVTRARKRSRQSNGSTMAAARAESSALAESEAEDDAPQHVSPSTMKKYSSMKSWEHLVQMIETVEKTQDNKLAIYFQMKGLAPCVEDARVCAEKFPQKLIQFYEGNLRWKEGEPVEETEADAED